MYYIGIMSGTSLDGIDAVLVKDINGKLVMVDSMTQPFSSSLKLDLTKLLETFVTSLEKLGEIDCKLGISYANAVNALLKKSKVNKDDVIAIGCHGQTIFHQPRGEFPFTMQIGDGNRVAALTGIKTVCDIRRMDVAFGGDGAPLAPAFHNGYFRSKEENRVILNMGGIANITILNNDTEKVIGFDTGPANCLMDLWIQRHKDLKYDKNGEWAASGRVNELLLNELLSEDYLCLAPPKSTGKELFNLAWLDNILTKFSEIKPVDVQATLCDFTAITIANMILKYAPTTQAIYSCGGGAYNTYLQDKLSYHLNGLKVSTTDALGIPVHWVEAIAFAWLAMRRIKGKSGNMPTVTGASKEVLLGAVYEC